MGATIVSLELLLLLNTLLNQDLMHSTDHQIRFHVLQVTIAVVQAQLHAAHVMQVNTVTS